VARRGGASLEPGELKSDVAACGGRREKEALRRGREEPKGPSSRRHRGLHKDAGLAVSQWKGSREHGQEGPRQHGKLAEEHGTKQQEAAAERRRPEQQLRKPADGQHAMRAEVLKVPGAALQSVAAVAQPTRQLPATMVQAASQPPSPRGEVAPLPPPPRAEQAQPAGAAEALRGSEQLADMLLQEASSAGKPVARKTVPGTAMVPGPLLMGSAVHQVHGRAELSHCRGVVCCCGNLNNSMEDDCAACGVNLDKSTEK
jgi:hypothetical protein